ncbi:MAG: DUF3299 domain-containing protein [Phycisphaeraceae bacterium]|nr:DUF3299 domain-containing protein [Phycisphaeraceae bacterium]
MKNVLIASMGVVCGLANAALGGDTPGSAPAIPPESPAAAAPAAPAATTKAESADASKSATKDGAKANAKSAKAEPAAPALAPGAVGDLALLQQHFPALKATSKPDGTLVIDERFAVKGKGTLEDPFITTWDHLTSAAEVYDPRKGQKKIPDSVQMLDGQYVTVTGYVAFPIYVKEPKEMLSMLNQWDGCCIGIPPTPYDAIEVHLKDAATKEQRMATYGTVTGRLSVKPYLVGDWLVGLYVMDEAVVSQPKQGGSGS